MADSPAPAPSGMKLQFNEIPNFRRGMNVLDIETPAILEQTASTGIPFLDDAFGGKGFTPSSVNLLTGTPGAGKTTLLLQLADSLTAQGHVCLYNTGEESLLQVRRTVRRLRCQHGFVPGADRMVDDVLDHADELAGANPGKQVFVITDSLQTLDDGFYPNGHTNSMTPIRCAERLTEWAKATFGVVIMIGHVTKDGKLAGKQQLKHTIDAHAELFIDENKKSETFGLRVFRVTKNRWGSAGLPHILDMTENGLKERGIGTVEYEDE